MHRKVSYVRQKQIGNFNSVLCQKSSVDQTSTTHAFRSIINTHHLRILLQGSLPFHLQLSHQESKTLLSRTIIMEIFRNSNISPFLQETESLRFFDSKHLMILQKNIFKQINSTFRRKVLLDLWLWLQVVARSALPFAKLDLLMYVRTLPINSIVARILTFRV